MSHIYTHVFERVVPNFLGAKVPLPTNLHIKQWEDLVVTPEDQQVVEMLTCGYPTGYTGPIPTPTLGNYLSTNNHASHVEAYISKETAEDAMLARFHSPPPLLSPVPN